MCWFVIPRYFLRATISRRLNDISKEMDIVVHTLSTYPELNSSIKMEVGIEDCLHIEFEYNKSKYVWPVSSSVTHQSTASDLPMSNEMPTCVPNSRYHLKDVIVGKIYFLLVRIKIKHMEIDIIKRETTGTGPSVYHENDTIAKYEIMDGAPVRGEFRHFLYEYSESLIVALGPNQFCLKLIDRELVARENIRIQTLRTQ